MDIVGDRLVEVGVEREAFMRDFATMRPAWGARTLRARPCRQSSLRTCAVPRVAGAD